MVTSVWDEDELYYAAYALGTMIGGRFVAQTWGRLTYGDSHYAPTYFLDADGRSCLMFWLRGIEGDGWTGAHSVPHVLGLQGDRLVASPHPNIERRRRPGDILNTVDSLAADATWEGTGLVITSGGNPVAQLAVDADVAVTVGRVTQRMPYDRGSVRVMVDGPVLEVSTSAGLLAMPITPSGSALTFEGDGTLWLYSVL
jgi:beta-fructofuranosidase